MLTYLILMLATWRITSLLVSEMGPGNILEKLRYWLGVRYDESLHRYGQNVVAEAFTCVWCLSVWVGLALTVAFWLWPVVIGWVAMPFALSAAAIVIDKLANRN